MTIGCSREIACYLSTIGIDLHIGKKFTVFFTETGRIFTPNFIAGLIGLHVAIFKPISKHELAFRSEHAAGVEAYHPHRPQLVSQ